MVSQRLGSPQLITPLIAGQPRIVPYLMWYNSIPFFYLWNLICTLLRIKGLDPLIVGKKKGYVANVTKL